MINAAIITVGAFCLVVASIETGRGGAYDVASACAFGAVLLAAFLYRELRGRP